jgi:hypothetical protein
MVSVRSIEIDSSLYKVKSEYARVKIDVLLRATGDRRNMMHPADYIIRHGETPSYCMGTPNQITF